VMIWWWSECRPDQPAVTLTRMESTLVYDLSMQHPRHIMYFSFTAFWWRLSLPWGDILALAYKGPTLTSTHTSVGFSITDRSTFCMYKIYSEESWEKERQREKELRESERERESWLFFFFRNWSNCD
jgi:hypothetical protein